jgi:ankyrin repeat protein
MPERKSNKTSARTLILVALLAIATAIVIVAPLRVENPIESFYYGILPSLRQQQTFPPSSAPNFQFNESAFSAFVATLRCDATWNNVGSIDPLRVLAEKLKIEPDNPYVWAASAEVRLWQFETGLGHVSTLPEAMTFALRAVNSPVPIALGHVTIAKLYVAAGDAFRARRHMDRANGLGVAMADSSLVTGQISELLNNHSASERHFTEAIGQNWNKALKAQAAVLLGDSFVRRGRFEDAERQYRLASSFRACSSAPERRLAQLLLFGKNDVKAADAVLRQALSAFPHPEIKQLLSLIALLEWSKDHPPGQRRTSRAREILASAHVDADEMFLAAARFDLGKTLIRDLLGSQLIRTIEVMDGKSNTALIVAAESNALSVAAELLSRGANVNAANFLARRPLGFFSAHGNSAAVALLLSKNAEIAYVDVAGDSPLGLAVKRGHGDIVHLLLRSGADGSVDNLLFEAAIRGDLRIVKLLVAAGANVNASAGQVPPLIGAFFSGDISTVRFLLESNADTTVTFDGRNVRDYAIDSGNPAVVELLAGHKKRHI